MKRPLHRALATSFLLLPLVALPSCGGAADAKTLTDDGMSALNSGDHDDAATKFAAALEALADDTANVQYARAKMGHIEATIRSDAAAAKDEFLAYAASNEATPDDYSAIGRKFASAGKFSEAIDILDAGMKKFEGSDVLNKLVDNIKTAAEKAGDSGALSKMAGLGYL